MLAFTKSPIPTYGVYDLTLPNVVEATERNGELVEGMVVELQAGNRDRDEYNRLLRYVYVDGTFVNAVFAVYKKRALEKHLSAGKI